MTANKLRILIALISLSLITFSCTKSTTGGETVNEKIALFMPDGFTPAINASVQFYEIGDTATSPDYQTSTDSDGKYSVDGVTSGSGYFNVIAEYEDSLYTMQDSVFISSANHFVRDDTLNNPGSISGIVALQPNHSHLLNNVYVIALGMGRAVNVDTAGRFTLANLAPGDYDLQVDTDVENYGPKFVSVSINSGVNDTITDTIYLPFSAIPVVTGLSTLYDTLNGVVTINWSPSSYGDIANYLIYKRSSGSLEWPETPVGGVSSLDSCFMDTIFTTPSINANTYNYDYSVVIKDNGTVIGSKYKYIQTVAVSPLEVISTIDINVYNKATNLLADTLSTSDTAKIILSVSNNNRSYREINWAINHPDSIVKTFFFDSTKSSEFDTLDYRFTLEVDYKLFVSVEDNGGTIWKDSIIVPVWNLPTPVTLSIDSIFAHTANLRWTKSVEKDFKNYIITNSLSPTFDICKDTIISNINDTTLQLSNLYSSSKLFFKVCVQDSNNIEGCSNIIEDTTITIWYNKKEMPTSRYSATAEIINNKAYVIGGVTGGASPFCDIVEEYDIISNTWSTKTPIQIKTASAGSCVHNGILYVIGGYADCMEAYDPQTDTWKTKSPMPTSRSGLIVEVINNKIYAIGGGSIVEQYDILSDTWTSKSSLPETASGHQMSVVFNNKIFLFSEIRNDSNSTYYVYEYDDVNDTWNHKTSIIMPGLRFRKYIPFVYNDMIYLSGQHGYEWNINGLGDGNGANCRNHVLKYNPTTNSYKTILDEPVKLNKYFQNRSHVSINNNLYLFAGDHVMVTKNDVEHFILPTK